MAGVCEPKNQAQAQKMFAFTCKHEARNFYCLAVLLCQKAYQTLLFNVWTAWNKKQ
jgi:hypothetical protein